MLRKPRTLPTNAVTTVPCRGFNVTLLYASWDLAGVLSALLCPNWGFRPFPEPEKKVKKKKKTKTKREPPPAAAAVAPPDPLVGQKVDKDAAGANPFSFNAFAAPVSASSCDEPVALWASPLGLPRGCVAAAAGSVMPFLPRFPHL